MKAEQITIDGMSDGVAEPGSPKETRQGTNQTTDDRSRRPSPHHTGDGGTTDGSCLGPVDAGGQDGSQAASDHNSGLSSGGLEIGVE